MPTNDERAAGLRGLRRAAAAALMAGGVLASALNLLLTPRMPIGEGSAAVASSTAFGIRMPLAAAVIGLVTFGMVGLWAAHAERLRLGGLAFLLAGVGGLTGFAVESVQATLVRDLAFVVPDRLDALEAAGALVRWNIGFAVGASLFALGWIAVSIVVWRARLLSRRGPFGILAGLLLVPILGTALGTWGAVVGNVVLGAGWVVLGADLWACRATGVADTPSLAESRGSR